MKAGRGSYGEPGAELYQVEMKLHRTTELAMLMSDDGDIENAHWLPKSQCNITPTEKPKHYVVTMPEWLAKKNELI